MTELKKTVIRIYISNKQKEQFRRQKVHQLTEIPTTIVFYLLFFKHICFTEYFHCIHMPCIFLLNKPNLKVIKRMPS